MRQQVGRVTLAIALIAGGAVLIAENLFLADIARYGARLWPGLLILLGLEWLAASRRSEANSQHVKTDIYAIAVLVIFAVVAASAGGFTRVVHEVPSMASTAIPHPHSSPSPPRPPQIAPLPFGSASHEVVHKQALDAGAIRELVVSSSSGDIRVSPGDKLQVEMKVKAYGVSAEDARRNAAGVHLRVAPEPVARVEAVVPQNVAGRFSVSYQIEVPADLLVHLVATTTSGDVQIESVKGDVRVSTTSGRITVTEAAGKVEAQASSGHVAVTAIAVGGDYDLGATSGTVELTLPADAPVTVTARATSGTVRGPSWLTIGEGRNSGTGAQGDGRHKISIRTSSGSIRIESR